MTDYTFTKLFSTITDSSIWCEDSDTRVVWVTMLAMADSGGRVLAAIPGLAKRAAVSIEATKKALGKFLAPDEYSRDKEHDGRRIREIDGGWLLLNYGKYREARNDDERKAYMREYMKQYRKQHVNNVSENKPPLAKEEADIEADREEEKEKKKYSVAFLAFWDAYPKKQAKGAAWKRWQQSRAEFPAIDVLIESIKKQAATEQWRKDGGAYIPNPATWLNSAGWENDIASMNCGRESKPKDWRGDMSKVPRLEDIHADD